MKIFTVYDSKAEAFVHHFFSLTAGTAVRSFEQAVNEESHEFAKFAGDYTLFQVGEIEDSTGVVKGLDAPINLGLALTFIRNKGQLHAMTPPLESDATEIRAFREANPESRVQGGE